MSDETDYTRFSLKDMFVLVVLPRLEGIEKKLDERLDEINEKLDTKASAVDVDALETRVGLLEAWRNRIVGAVALAGALAAAALAIVLKHFHIG